MIQTKEEILQHGPLELAYVGDCVYELRVRTYLSGLGSFRIGELHDRAVAFVSAPNQARAAKAVLEVLTEPEREVFLRGRNARPHGCPKGASRGEYAYATALESLFGYLYLMGEEGRIDQLFAICLELLEVETDV